MPRISQVAMVLGTLGLCIAINNWRYPIVRQMVAQLPCWEFSIQPKQAEGIASISAPVTPSPEESERKTPHGSHSSSTLTPLSVGLPSPPLGNLPSSTSLSQQELPFKGKTSFLPTQSRDGYVGTPPSEAPPKEENQALLPEGLSSQQKGSPSGTPEGLAVMSPKSHSIQNDSGANRLSTPPLVPLYPSGRSSEGPKQNEQAPPSPDRKVVCTGSSCKLQSPPPDTLSPAQPAGTGTVSGLPTGRARILQVRAVLPDGENTNNPAEELLPTDNLLVPSPEEDDVHQNRSYYPSKEDKIELLPPVDPPGGGLHQGTRVPWPSNTIPLYPSTHRN